MQGTPTRLVPHPAAALDGAWAIAAGVSRRDDGGLDVAFTVSGPLEALAIPPAAAPRRSDGLWRHTCVELFVAVPGAAPYLEFNLAPSTAWAAYAFSAYRVPAALPALAAPSIRATRAAARLTLAARLDSLPGLAPTAPLAIGLCAVLESRAGALGYYALGHPAAEPDFHAAAGFVLALPGAAAPARAAR